ncbi:hypothetical protein KQX54_021371 [Cotesia glomerata]|uniref:Uncharacterized protein n=1 Tax=Cotesia glomerata TaxID=32391 RepID=A0AAV7J726_COTGL|nr:hypothetical protein KQX54_021371 [Cotesia glomerata]
MSNSCKAVITRDLAKRRKENGLGSSLRIYCEWYGGYSVWLGSKSITNEEIRRHRWLLDERGEPVVLRVPCRRERTYVHTLNYRYIHLVLWVPEVTASRRYFPTVPYGVGSKYAVEARS